MDIYLFTIIVTYGLAILAVKYGSLEPSSPTTLSTRPNKVLVAFIITVLVLISGLRYMNYYQSDEWIYRQTYLNMSDDINFFSVFESREWGFHLINQILHLLNPDPQFLVFVIALITNTLIILTLAEYGRPFELSIFLYVALGYFVTSFNIMRQYLAMAILLWGIRYIFSRKFIKYCLVVFAAATIHVSAWLALPVYFFVRRKVSIATLVFSIILAVTIIIGFQGITGVFLTESFYGQYMAHYEENGYGVNPIRILTVSVIPVILLFKFKKNLLEVDAKNAVLIQYNVISLTIMLMSGIYVYVARINSLFEVASALGISQLSRSPGHNKIRKLLYLAIVLISFLFGLYQAYISPVYYNVLFNDFNGKTL